MKDIKVGILGFGTVGSGVALNLINNGELISARTGVKLTVHKIADRDITRDRGVAVTPEQLTTDLYEVINDPDVDIILEVIGGTTLAREVVVAALKQKKAVVTANKALLAYHGAELFGLARENGVDLYFEASVGGGIPIIKSIREGLASNHIEYMMGILNGTCNYILTRMVEEGKTFDVLLPDAQAAGYAEADPTLDVDGFDTAHKTVILSSLAYGQHFSMEDVSIKGIREVELQDVKLVEEFGCRMKLLSVIRCNHQTGRVSLSVEPTIIPRTALLGAVNGVFNAGLIHGDTVDDVMLYGPGAGRDATASAVVADIIDCALNLQMGCVGRVENFRSLGQTYQAVPEDDQPAQFYVRATVKTEGGVAKVAEILKREGLACESRSVADASQAVFITEKVRRSIAESAVAACTALDLVKGEAAIYRYEAL